jgi:hypothetical protein
VIRLDRRCEPPGFPLLTSPTCWVPPR